MAALDLLRRKRVSGKRLVMHLASLTTRGLGKSDPDVLKAMTGKSSGNDKLCGLEKSSDHGPHL